MNQVLDFSLHFSLKAISVVEVEKKFQQFVKSNDIQIPGDETRGTEVVLHHCFIPRRVVERKNMDPDVCNTLDRLCKRQVNWYSAGGTLDENRKAMLLNLSRVDGIAIFIGPVVDGVKIESALAETMGVETYHIP